MINEQFRDRSVRTYNILWGSTVVTPAIWALCFSGVPWGRNDIDWFPLTLDKVPYINNKFFRRDVLSERLNNAPGNLPICYIEGYD